MCVLDEPGQPVALGLALLHDDPVELGVVGREADEVRHHQLGHRLVVHAAQPGHPLRQRPRQVLEELADGRPPQLLLAAEVVGQEGLLHAGPLGDQAGAGALERPLGEQVEGGGEDPLPCAVGRGSLHPLLHGPGCHGPTLIV